MFLVELTASSFLDLISKQARLIAAVSAFLFIRRKPLAREKRTHTPEIEPSLAMG